MPSETACRVGAARGSVRTVNEQTISSLIKVADSGDASAASALFATLYSELHRLARAQLARSSKDLTIGATSLLHDVYLDLAARENAFPDQGRFMAYAARAMRGLIIDYVRNRNAHKRGGLFEITRIDEDVHDVGADDSELTRISEALDELANVDQSLAHVVDLKFFCGFSFAEIAAMSGESERTVQRRWEKARIWLHRSLGRPV